MLKLGIEQAIRAGIHIDMPDVCGRTALMKCALRNDIPAMRTMLKLGASLDAKDLKGRTTLGLMAMKGNVALVKLLLRRMANVNSQDRDGNTVLMLSVQSGKLHVVEELLKNTSLDLLRLNSKKRNVIFTAILYKRPGLVEKMITSKHVSQ